MKYIKTYENLDNYNAGDIVVSLGNLDKNNRGYDLIKNEPYRIIKKEDPFIEIEKYGTYNGYFLMKRFRPATEDEIKDYNLNYDANKYNV